MPPQQRAGLLGRTRERDRIRAEKRIAAQRPLGRAVEKQQIGKRAAPDARAERIGRRGERNDDRHGPTNFLPVPRSALTPGRGRHSAVCSISFASSTSLVVTPPALCVDSFTCTFPQLTARSG